jgi:peptide/nickel transport system substrate-binding protein
MRAALLGALALAATACGERSRPADSPRADGGPAYGGTLVVAAQSDLDFANSLLSVETYTQELIRFALFLPLLQDRPDSGFEPRLARSWELFGDTAVVFHLRDDVRWHDGERTTAYDVAFTFERARDPETGSPSGGDFQGWQSAEVLDSFTVRFRFEPRPDPLGTWATLAIMPHHLLDSIPAARLRHAPFNKEPVGNGPFRFVSSAPNDRWIFEANPEFPAELGGRPYLDRLVWRVVPESSAQITELLTGRADLVIAPPAQKLAELATTPGVKAVVKPSRKVQAILLNGKRRGLDDARVRRALAMAIDRHELLAALRAGYGSLASGPVYPTHWGYDSTLVPLPFDPAAARALLTEAGYRDRDGDGFVEGANGRPLTLSLTIPVGSDYSRNVAERVQMHLAAIGVKLTPRVVDFATMAADITSPERRFDAALLDWDSDLRGGLGDLFHSAAVGTPYQFASYKNPAVDTLLDRLTTERDRNLARPLWFQLQATLQQDQPWLFLFYVPGLFALNERVQGVEMDTRGALVTLPRWWLSGGAVARTAEGEK